MMSAEPAEAARRAARRAAVARGRVLFNRGEFWDSHEAWEGAWRITDGPERDGLQGLVQAAAAFHKFVVQDHAAGACRLIDRAAAALAPIAPCGLGLDLRALLGELAAWRARLAEPPTDATIVALPHLDWAPAARAGGVAPMVIESVDLRLVEVAGRRSLVAAVSGDGVTGWGEVVVPWDDHGAWSAARTTLAPALLTEAVASPAELPVRWRGLAAERRAAAALEMAAWDAAARRAGLPFHTVLGIVTRPVAVAQRLHGVSAAALAEGIDRARRANVGAVHVPARPNADRRLLPGLAAELSGLWYAFDLDAAYRMADVAALRVLADLRPAFLHRVFAADALADVRHMGRWLDVPLSIGEIGGADALANAHALGAAAVVQVDVGWVGPYEARRMLELASALGVAAWVGSPSLTPIGARASLAVAASAGAGLPCAPGDGWTAWECVDALASDGTWTPPPGDGLALDPPTDWLAAHEVIHERLQA